MNGAELMMQTFLANGVELVVGNPGTSEMQFIAALDSVPQIRAVLALFEGVATGAADGYGRMADKPAATLLHLGPGLGNGLANLHNARRAHTPIVNVVGEHATFHRKYDPPLYSDIESIARGASEWTRTIESVATLSGDVAAAVAASLEAPGKVTTLVLPADVAWSDATGETKKATVTKASRVSQAVVDEIAKILKSGEPAALLLNGRALREPALRVASRIGRRAGARVLCDTFPARLERGAGRPVVERLPYIPQMILSLIADVKHLILVSARAPVSFFAFPHGPSTAVPEGCQVHTLAAEGDDALAALERLADALGASGEPNLELVRIPPPPTGGAIEPDSLGAALGATLPENAIVVDESNTVGYLAPMGTAGCAPHDWLCLTGGSIGMGLPVATGAALACPDRRVIALDGDGSAMYTIQALWTQAREKLNITNVILANRSYAILNLEMMRMGLGQPGPVAKQMLDLTNPALDFVSMGKSMGVPSCRVTTADALVDELRRSYATEGPTLIEALIQL
jgi:acetolactate synthase-1/2/3 large subunit